MFYLFILFIIISISISPFLKKKALNTLNIYTYVLISLIFMIFLKLCFVLYHYKNLQSFNNIGTKNICYILTATLLTTLPGFCYIYLLQNYNVTKVNPIISPASVMLGFLVGVLIYKEKVSSSQCIGVVITTIGVLTFFYDKYKKK